MVVKVYRVMSRFKIIFIFAVAFVAVFVICKQNYIFYSQPIMLKPPSNALYLDRTQLIEVRVADLLSYMSLEEKIGQMALVEKNSLKERGDISAYYLGALLSGSGSKPKENTAVGWKEMTDAYQAEAKQSRLRIPLLYGSDAIHGHAHVLEATVFPHAIGLGATHNPEIVRQIANATAKELVATGVNWNFSPNLDQPQDIRWGRGYETFSDDPKLVSMLGVAYLQGLQTNIKEKRDGVFVLATLKHYIGLGSMSWDSSLNKNFKIDQGITADNEVELRARYLPPFTESINAGALSVMVGLNTWGDKRMVLQKYLLTDVLKQELGFKGFVVSDWYGIHEGRTNTFWATVQAVNAGVDMAMLPFDYKTFTQHIKWANRLGLISDKRIDEAVGRILYAKFALGLFDENETDISSFSIPDIAHHTLAREAVAQSLVLLKNEYAVLPLKADTKFIRVAGSAADNIGQQMGAWSVEWQGIDGNPLVGGTSILEGIQSRAGVDTQVEYSRSGNFLTNKNIADVGIAIVGEKPYAEGWGDKAFPILSEEDLLAIKNLQVSSKKVVVIIVSGRPLLIENEIDSWDALVAAWLPGSEGAGVADVLFGIKPFKGTLPLPWPSHLEQLPIALDETTADNTVVLFSRHFGLKY
jgi:beta-glucosidase